ncbi:hypothetical protein [Streptosporangium sp. NPDC006007]|uniref:hypothetical protein n=1 Tax=Streptosporangium sp. NPDC006007 TaxID=3154575 RepID=UPI0033B76A02
MSKTDTPRGSRRPPYRAEKRVHLGVVQPDGVHEQQVGAEVGEVERRAAVLR